MTSTHTDDRLIRYLLGQATEEERTQVEERLFADDSFEEELLATADEVMHDYLAGRLGGAERLFFEERFLAVPRHRERLAFLRGLRTVLPPPPPRALRWLGPAVAAGVAAAAIGVLWLSSEPVVAPGRPTPVAALDRGPAAPEPTSTSAPAPTVEGRQGPATAAPPVLPSPRPRVRYAAVPQLRLPSTPSTAQIALAADTERVRVEVEVAPDPPSFDAILRSKEGLEVWRAAGLTPPAGEPLVVEIPARLLQESRYALLIEGEGVRGGGTPAAVEYRLEIVRSR